MRMVHKVFPDKPPYLALLANKADLTHERLVQPISHVDFADSLNMHRYESSHACSTQHCCCCLQAHSVLCLAGSLLCCALQCALHETVCWAEMLPASSASSGFMCLPLLVHKLDCA